MDPFACACCGTWVRVKGVEYRGRKYGVRCAAFVKNARQASRPHSDLSALRFASLAARHPRAWSHAVAHVASVSL